MSTDSKLKFGPAWHQDKIVYGARRPGYPAKKGIGLEPVQEWISFMKQKKIRRVCCLLSQEELAYYACDLLGEYKKAFGPDHVCAAPVENYRLCDERTLTERILPFLQASEAAQVPVVVHCSGGSGRTGHVLAAWLVRVRGLTPEVALSAARQAGRDPWEAITAGQATKAQLQALLMGPSKSAKSQG